MTQVTCDDCDGPVSTTGHLGGEIVCPDCARARREEFKA